MSESIYNFTDKGIGFQYTAYSHEMMILLEIYGIASYHLFIITVSGILFPVFADTSFVCVATW